LEKAADAINKCKKRDALSVLKKKKTVPALPNWYN
jgi:hypothetical protein